MHIYTHVHAYKIYIFLQICMQNNNTSMGTINYNRKQKKIKQSKINRQFLELIYKKKLFKASKLNLNLNHVRCHTILKFSS